jgi:hypothetical protein
MKQLGRLKGRTLVMGPTTMGTRSSASDSASRMVQWLPTWLVDT